MKRSNWPLYLGLALAAAMILAALFAPFLAPNDPLKVDMKQMLAGSSTAYPLGTDQLGRCVFSRLLYGARTSLSVTCMVLVMTVGIGTVVGTISGLFAERWPDRLLTAVCEVVLAFPGMILALVVSGLLGPGIENIMLAVALVSWAKYARMVRNLVIGIGQMEYIKAARVAGTNRFHLVTWHILPNIAGTVGTVLVTDVGSTILRLAGLSFIGLGAQPPEPEWGMMINEARMYLESAPGLILCPVAAVSLTVLSFHLIGDSIRDRMDTEVG